MALAGEKPIPIMPIYEYRCTACGHELEALQKFSDAPLSSCPACHGESLQKKVSAAGFQLKGSGWYVTDFKGNGAKSPGKSANGNGESKNAEAGNGKGEGKSDSKSETKSESKAESSSSSSTPASSTGSSTAS